MKIVWLPLARLHLEDIYSFNATKSEKAAINLFNHILDAVEPLLRFPEMAKIEPLLKDTQPICRSLVVHKNYKVIYYIKDDTVYITAVWDCRQNPEILKTNK